jgi:ABC-type transport system involved in multi-copper enzyme maturation permease subunit
MPIFLRWLLRLGPTNPIAVRLVQNGSRRTRHLYIRSAYLAVLIVVLLWALLIKTSGSNLSSRELAAAGAESFTWIAYLQIALICILAPVFMGGAIAQEASPRTWEVLLTTPLGAGEIVLGNLLGRLFFVVGLVLASLPLFALTQFFGGVPGPAILASTLVACAAALIVGALAISLSVSRLVGKRAFFAFYVCIVSYLAITIAVDVWLRSRGFGAPTATGNTGVTYMTALNPFLALHALLNPSTYARWTDNSFGGLKAFMLETPVTAWCAGATIISIVFLAASTLTVRAGGLQSLGEGSSGVPWTRRLLGARGGGGAAGGTHRAPRQVWTNPIAWREAAARQATVGKALAKWAFLATGALGGLAIVWAYHSGSLGLSDFRFVLLAVVWGELAVISLVALNTSATAISREREDGTLDLLLTTPITASAYLMGKLRGVITYLMPMLAVPLGTLGAAGLYALLGDLAGFATASETVAAGAPGAGTVVSPVVLPEAVLLGPIAIVPFMAFCVMVGLQWSLKSKGTLSSVVASVAVVGAVAGVMGVCAWAAASSIQVIGPVLAGFSPASLIYALVEPAGAMGETVGSVGLAAARLSLGIGACIAGLAFAAMCYGIHANMVRTFDMTVRRLAGNR